MKIRSFLALVSSTLLLPTLVPIAVHAAAVTTVVRPSSPQGWVFNGDPTTATPYNFTNDKHSIGDGSLYVQPISGANALNKFIASKVLNAPTADLSNVSYDFLIAGSGGAASADQFYLNVYTNLPGSTSYYDCRFDYVPTSGSTSSFMTASFDATSLPVNVAPRGGATCPSKLSDMLDGSKVSVIAINVGDTSTSDTGLAGYLDKAVITLAGDTTTYDFEKDLTYPMSRDDCKNGGYAAFTGENFKNQGQCIKYVNKHAYRVRGKDITYTAYSTMPRHASFDMNTASQSGYFHYVDDPARVPGQPSHTKYTAKISAVKVDGNFAYFAGQVTDSNVNSFIGNWVFVKVEKGGSQKIWGSFTSQSAALMGVQNMTNPGDGSFAVTSGIIHINQ